MNNSPLYLVESNLSLAWAKAMLELAKPGREEIAPLVITVTGFTNGQVNERQPIRELLDEALRERGKCSCSTVASTIFPQSIWAPSQPRSNLFARYDRLLPLLKRDDHRNRYGTYFERLVAYRPRTAMRGRSTSDESQPAINQLDRIITAYQAGNHRRSALQATTFDPAADVNGQQRRGFPCLQQIAFSHLAGGILAVTAFYAYQHVFEKAYGNYLGLCNLGNFMAHELGLSLGRMTCVSAVAKRDISAGDLARLRRRLEPLMTQGLW